MARPQGDPAPPSGVYQGEGSVMTASFWRSENGQIAVCGHRSVLLPLGSRRMTRASGGRSRRALGGWGEGSDQTGAPIGANCFARG